MPSTILQVSGNANDLFTALSDELIVDLTIPAVVLDLDIPLPLEDATNDAFADIASITLADLTTQAIGGSGVFDALMNTMTQHLSQQFEKGRITGKEYAEVYLGGMQSILAQSVQFLVSKDKIRWDALLVREQTKLVQLQGVNTKLQIQLSKLQVVEQKLTVAKVQVQAYTAKSEYASSKMGLSTGFTGIHQNEAQTQLILEQYEGARAQTRNTLSTGEVVVGLAGAEKLVKDKQALLVSEQIDTARAATKDTNQAGGAIAGLSLSEKQLKAAQIELSNEQIDAQRASTKDTLRSGGAITGITAQDKLIKQAQVKLINEQYEGQRGQVRGTLSTGGVIAGVLGAQTSLYLQQTESYKHDSKSKAVKMLLDTWTARKTIDEGVEVPSQIDTAALNISIAAYRAAVDVD